jgi:purine-binding chemotaxis protein CheW
VKGAGLHLIVRLAGDRIALPAAEIDSVVEIDVLTPVPGTPPYVAGLAALRSRVLTVIDAHAALGLPPSGRPPAAEAVMLGHEGHCYALLVEAVEDAIDFDVPLEPLRAQPAPAWARVARGIVAHDGGAMLVVAPGALVGGTGGAAPAAVNPALTPAA